MSLNAVPGALIGALPLAALYAVIGLGWVILFRATKILNFATGQFLMLGAYIFYVTSSVLRMPFVIAVLVALGAMAVIGAVVHLVLIRPLAGQKGFGPIIETFGLSIVLDSLVHVIFGGNSHALSLPIPKGSVTILPNVAYTNGDFLMIGLAVVVLIGSFLAIRYSRWGIQMRAAAEDSLLASQSGINIDRVFVLGWSATLVVLTLMGIAWGAITVLTPDLETVGLNGLAPVIVGGMDSIAGVLPGALIVAVAQNLAELAFGQQVQTTAVMVVVLVAIVIRPWGLMGTRDVARV